MLKKYREWISVQSIKNPRRVILINIIMLNITMMVVGSVVIKGLSLQGTEGMPFIQAVFCTISMILDPGSIQLVIDDVGESGVILALVCFIIVVFGMISFNGAIIGYVTNFISTKIEESNSYAKVLECSDHMVILNWNNRGAEIINDLLYADDHQTVVVMVSEGQERIERQINEKILATIARENNAVRKDSGMVPGTHGKKLKDNLTVIVREGDVYSHKQLLDISVEKAKTIIILGDDKTDSAQEDLLRKRGNVHTIKTLMQIADMTASEHSADDQNIIVEVNDPWTLQQVRQIIDFKQVDGKCNITPLKINEILGQILSQFTILPELNGVYDELFSNFGAAIYSEPANGEKETEPAAYLKDHCHAIPLGQTEGESRSCFYYMANSEKDVRQTCRETDCDTHAELNRKMNYGKRTIIVIGRNSKYKELMEGYQAYLNEWPDSAEVMILDSSERLCHADNYRDYPFVTATMPIDLCDPASVPEALRQILTAKKNDISILILSDDQVDDDDIDADALSNLIFVQTEVNRYRKQHPEEARRIDVIVELVDPKHHDIVTSYNVDNVVISNRYISKLITQIGEKEELYSFFTDILTYDRQGAERYVSKEIYVRKATAFFRKLPEKMSVYQLIRAVAQSPDNENSTMLLGYIRNNTELHLFSGDLSQQEAELQESDLVVLFSPHI